MSWISEPWPWYVTGPLIGLIVPILLYFGNKQFGISSSMKDVCAATIPGKVKFFQYDWKASQWRLWFVGGVMLGGFIAVQLMSASGPAGISDVTKTRLVALGITDFSGILPSGLFSWEALGSVAGLVMVVLGGFFVGFGTRYANGCTSGHAIMGMSKLSGGSLIAVIGFFIGGLAVSWLVLPHLLG